MQRNVHAYQSSKLNQDTTSRQFQVSRTAVQTEWSRGKSVWGAPN